MKKTLAMSSLLLAFALGSCSSDEPDNGGTTGGDEIGYVAVNIVQPNSTASRAFGEDDFSNGDDIESIAEYATFFVFNKDGNLVGDVQKINITGTEPEQTKPIDPAVEKIYNAVVVINGVTPQPDNEREYQLVCVLNDNSTISAVSGLKDIKSLAELKKKCGDYRATRDGESFNFIMTNSVYKNNENSSEILGAVIESNNIKTTPDEAKNSPVDVYVERVVARIDATEGSGGMTNDGASVPNSTPARNLTIDITGIEIANIASTSYLFKNIDNFATDYNKTGAGVEIAPSFAWVWDSSNKRSYWETVQTDLAYENQSYNQIIEEYSSLSLKEYVQPNTNQKQKTAVLVTAQLKENSAAADLAYIRGQYTTKDGARKLVAQAVANKFNYYRLKVGSTNEYEQLDYTDFEWENKIDNPSLTWLAGYEVVAKLAAGIENIYTVTVDEQGKQTATVVNDTETDKKLTTFKEFLSGTASAKSDYTARVYTDGKCYYFVNIDQTSVANGNKPANITENFDVHTFDGVVRNHIYKLTLESIGGIGVPVFDPSDIIIPETIPDETLYYVAAKINVLDWKLVTQGVEFEGK